MATDDQPSAPTKWAIPDDAKHLPQDVQDKMLEIFNMPFERRTYPEPMLPHWEAFPDIPWPSNGWRMGGGEDYDTDFLHWFLVLSNDARKNYIENNPEPKGWEGFWQRVDDCCNRMRAKKP
jgi:hypothetical protein